MRSVGILLAICFLWPATECHFDWKELADEIRKGNWCHPSSNCRPSMELSPGSTATAITGPNEMTDIKFVSTTCQCDDECRRYGDCCYDLAMTEKLATDKTNKDGPWSCLPLRFKDETNVLDEKLHLYMIDRCPVDWTGDESLPSLCQRDSALVNYSYLLDVPVLSLETNRTYANVFCARCHSDSYRLAKWNVSLACTPGFHDNNLTKEEMLTPSNYQRGMRQWSTLVAGEQVDCHLIINEFIDFNRYLKTTDSRRCLPRTENCAADWTDPIVESKCKAYTLLVTASNRRGVHVQVTVYKNPHCALCNHAQSHQIRCYQYTEKNQPRLFGRKTDYSFSMLIDFDFGGRGGGGADRRCRSNEIYDHFHDRCHAILCGSSYVNQEGTCVPKNQVDNNGTETPTWPDGGSLNSSCQRLVLMSHEYTRLVNGTVILNETGQMFHPEDYETDKDGQNITICAEGNQLDTYFRYSDGQRFLSDICLAVSVVCLALHIAIHTALPKLRNLPGKNLLSLSCALFTAQLLFLMGIGLREVVGYGLCAAMGVMTHWSYLAAFFWMNVMGFDICRTFSGSLTRHRGIPGREQRSTFRFYSLYAWGFPTLIVALGLTLDLSHLSEYYAPQYGSHMCWMDDWAPAYGTKVCWISNRSGLGVFFVLPMAILLFENLILFSCTVFSILKQRRAAQFALDKNQTYRKTSEGKGSSVTERLQPPGGSRPGVGASTNDKQKIRFILYIKLGLIMGLGWIFGFAAALAKVAVLWYPFIFFNALQGTFIFVAFACKRKVYYMLYQWATNRPHPSDTSSSSRTTPSNKPSSTHRISYVTTSSAVEMDPRNSKRFSTVDIHHGVPSIPGQNLTPQVPAVEIVRQWIQSSVSPASRAKRNLPRVVVTKHFSDEDVSECPPSVLKQPVSQLHVQNNNHNPARERVLL